jgi:hypothetical protein
MASKEPLGRDQHELRVAGHDSSLDNQRIISNEFDRIA